MEILHNNKILHRDLKSANIFVCKNGMAKIGDMNVSKIAKRGLLYTQTGTPYYASPEVWKDRPYDSKSDMWSLGCVIYEMASLKPPFRANDMDGLYNRVIKGVYKRLPSHYSQDLNNLIKALLRVKPNHRPSAEKLLNSELLLKRIERTTNSVAADFNEPLNLDLLRTIKLPKNLTNLTNRLPEPNYDPIKTVAMTTVARSMSTFHENTMPNLGVMNEVLQKQSKDSFIKKMRLNTRQASADLEKHDPEGSYGQPLPGPASMAKASSPSVAGHHDFSSPRNDEVIQSGTEGGMGPKNPPDFSKALKNIQDFDKMSLSPKRGPMSLHRPSIPGSVLSKKRAGIPPINEGSHLNSVKSSKKRPVLAISPRSIHHHQAAHKHSTSVDGRHNQSVDYGQVRRHNPPNPALPNQGGTYLKHQYKKIEKQIERYNQILKSQKNRVSRKMSNRQQQQHSSLDPAGGENSIKRKIELILKKNPSRKNIGHPIFKHVPDGYKRQMSNVVHGKKKIGHHKSYKNVRLKPIGKGKSSRKGGEKNNIFKSNSKPVRGGLKELGQLPKLK